MDETTRSPFQRRCRFAVSVAVTVLVVGAWAWAPHSRASDEETFKAAYSAAAAARKDVVKAGYEWRDTKKILRQARKLAKKGEYERAVELTNRARRQSELGLIQAEEQESAWKEAVLK